jgi:hypothetical protein
MGECMAVSCGSRMTIKIVLTINHSDGIDSAVWRELFPILPIVVVKD